MSTNPRRLYIFTGKGGVGKTTLSKSFVQYLNSQKQNALYLTFQNSSLGENHTGSTEKMINGIKEISLDLEEAARGYIEKRLNSKMISGWIVKTPFFRALINMVPGFTYLIFLGKILEMGKENPDLSIVLDAPASGHALTMVEATSNFQQIFESGIVFDDTAKMLAKLNDPSYTKINVVSLPSLMSWQEATELKTSLNERTGAQVDIAVNNCLYPLLENQENELPEGIRQKVLNEKELVKEHLSEMQCILPHSLSQDASEIQADLVGSLSKLI